MLHKTLSPRALIMSLLNAPERTHLRVGQLIRAGTLFDIEASAIRMAITRLIKDQLITSVKRGVYQAGEKAVKWQSEVQSWRTADQKMKPWQQEWIVAINTHLGRSNKTKIRAINRAYTLYGFIEIEQGIWLRPANLVESIEQLQATLIGLGVDEDSYLMTVSSLARERQHAWSEKWPVERLIRGYSEMIGILSQSSASLSRLSSDEAARESLLVGESAIRLINLDPLLPEQIIQTSLFSALIDKMKDYDALGQEYWRQFLSD